MDLVLQFFQDALFAAIAAIGFAAISRPPRKAYLWCAVIAAAGHSIRFLLMQTSAHVHIVIATTLAAFVVGVLAVLISPRAKVPAETYLFPALLPMIPGMYAYRTFGALVMCLYGGEQTFNHSFFLFASNGLTCFFILLGMVVGATLPIFFMPGISFRATRSKLI